MSKLTASKVDDIFRDCLFREEEEITNHVEGEGIMARFGFHPGRLASHKEEIRELLAGLPDSFHADKGGGCSFLAAHETRDGDHWGEHRNIEQLLALGIATRQARYILRREMWSILPGGMPYFCVLVKQPEPSETL